MSVDAQAQVVTEDSCQGQIADAIRHNAQMVQECQVSETVSAGEQKIAESQVSGEGGLAGRAASVGGSLSGNNHASVYGAMASDAALGGAGQMISTACDFIKGMKDPHAFAGATSIDEYIATGGSKKSEGKKSITTDHFNDLAARQKGINDFTKDGCKGVKSSPETVATFSKKRELACSAKMLSTLHLGNAKACEAKVGAKVAKAQQLGLGAQLVHDRMKHGPEFVEPKEVAAVETTEDWAGA